MSIRFNKEEKIFQLDTPNTTYLMGIFSEEKYLAHLYYGKKISKAVGAAYYARTSEGPFVPEKNDRDRTAFFDAFPTEYAGHGVGDFRESCIRIKTKSGHSAVSLVYDSHKITKGKEPLPGLPATFGTEKEVDTLVITCKDPVTKLYVKLKYNVFRDVDAITRSVEVINKGAKTIYLEKAMSGCFDMDDKDFDVLTMHGSWARERHMERKKLGHGRFNVQTLRGGNCHQEHPFMALLAKGAGQTAGEVYGFNFVYSGNFFIQAEKNQFNSVRVMMGIAPEDFSWKLAKGDSFQTPEMVMVYSAEGLGGMTRAFHDLYRKHLIRSSYLHQKRPILINNWEGTYFDFNETKIIDIAREGAKLGIEMLVLDDGWFGNRYDDNRSLGDWQVNTEKLKGGLPYLVSEINKLGMKFGLWFEPEMISPDSDLYRAHPDWAIQIPGRRAGLCRNQYVLDISRKEVRDAIMDMVFEVLHSANIEYVKWDMNRPLADLGSYALTTDCQGELYHRYVLGFYEMQERLLQEFPNLLLENCCSGGGRFDPGTLYFSPQIWSSDDTDAIERLMIQEGTSMIYPLSSMGAHVSVCPNHSVGRSTPFSTRGYVALAGTFGYELDVTKLSDDDKWMIPKQVEMYHTFNDLVREGDYYRVASYLENHLYDCFQVSSKDKEESLVFYTQVIGEPNYKSRVLKLQGLKPDKIYSVYQVDTEKEELVTDTGLKYSGEMLMEAGFVMERLWGDFKGRLLYLK